MLKLVWIAIAGGAGTLSRYALSELVKHLYGDNLPWGTVVVNLAGSFLFGLVTSLAGDRFNIIGPETRAILLIGFMGSFTTFSTFMFDTGRLLEDTGWGLATGNLVIQAALGLLFLYAGLQAGRAL